MHTIQKMNTERENLSAALLDLATGSRRNKTARLRDCFDEIEAAKAAGASNKTIVATLEANGLFYDVPNLKNACSRIRKEKALAALTQNSLAVKEIAPSQYPSPTPTKNIAAVSNSEFNKPAKTDQLKSTDFERKNINTESLPQLQKLLPGNIINPEYLNAMRKISKEKK